MTPNRQHKENTDLIRLGRNIKKSFGYVNIPPAEGSTVLFDNIEEMNETAKRRLEGDFFAFSYGTDAGPTHLAFFEAMNKLEGGAGTWAYGTGLAGCVIPVFAFTKSGDHVLVTDSVYGPTREFFEEIVAKYGVVVEFYDPLIGESIEELIRPNTTLIFLESPGTHTFEMQDVPAIAKVARSHGVVTMIDNTYATPLNFKPLEHGIDVVIHAATKYICGHADVLMSTVTCNEKTWPAVYAVSRILGQRASARDVYLGLRGLRTLKLRLDAVVKNTTTVVNWLEKRPEVDKILWPAHPNDPGYALFKRDFKGPSGLFGFTFKEGTTSDQIDRFVNALKIFGLGYSWGGFESLLIRSYGKRTVKQTPDMSRMVRVYVGLEDSDDLIADLEQAFAAMK